MPSVLVVVVVGAILVWLVERYVLVLMPPTVRLVVCAVMVVLLVLWVLGYYTPVLHWRR
jgi:hypothetical protein